MSGGGALTKLGGGTLTLTQTNAYSGGTVIGAPLTVGGAISVSADANLGAASGSLTFHSGTLQVTGTGFGSTARAVTISGNGAFDIVEGSHALTLSQGITGSGAYNKLGAGTLILTGASTFDGVTFVLDGTLRGNASSLQGLISNDASLVFDQGTNGTFVGSINGSGSLTKIGGGTLVLNSNNSYTGGTLVSAGTLQGTTASLQGDIAEQRLGRLRSGRGRSSMPTR